MKHAFWLFCLILLSAHSFAQSLRHRLQLGGAVHYSTSSTRAAKAKADTQELTTSTFQLQPMAGFFLGDNWVLGLQGNFQKSRYLDDRTAVSMASGPNASGFKRTIDLRTTSWSAGPYARYYLPLQERIYVFAHAGTGIGETEQEHTEASTTFNQNSGPAGYQSQFYTVTTRPLLFAHLKPGLVFFPIAKMGFEVSLGEVGYYHYGEGVKEKLTATLGLSSLQVGATLYFGN